MNRRGRESRFQRTAAAPAVAIALLAFLFSLPTQADLASAESVNRVEVFELPSGPSNPSQVATTSGGYTWVLYEDRPPHHLVPGTPRIGRLVPGGRIEEFTMPAGYPLPGEVAGGAGGDLWFQAKQRIGLIDTAGEAAYVASPDEPGHLAPGPGGSVWFTGETGASPEHNHPIQNVVGLLDTSGVVAEFPLPGNSFLDTTAAGAAGNLWFLQSSPSMIGRITPQGQISRFPLLNGQRPLHLTEGPEGDGWFTTGNAIDRVSLDGEITEFPLPKKTYAEQIAMGDGRLWFTNGPNLVGTITPNGVLDADRVPVPGYLRGVAAEPDGSVLYFSGGEGPCNGGGGGCILTAELSTAHGTIGRILPSPLSVEIDGRPRVSPGRVKVRVRCGGGEGTDTCAGKIDLTARVKPRDRRRSNPRTVAGGSTAFTLSADEEASVTVRLSRGARRLLAHRRGLFAAVTASASGAAPARTRLVLYGTGGHAKSRVAQNR